MSEPSMEELYKDVTDYIKEGGDDAKAKVLKGMQQAGEKWLSTKELNEQFEKAVKFAKEEKEENGDEDVGMTFILYGRRHDADVDDEDAKVVMPVLLADWPDGVDKQTVMKTIGRKFAEQFPDHMLTIVIQTAEAWQSQRQIDQPDEDLEIAPSKSPNREEILMVSAMSMDQRNCMYSAKIVRDADGNFVRLKQLHHQPYDPKADHKKDGFAEMQNFLSAGIFMGNGDVKRANFTTK